MSWEDDEASPRKNTEIALGDSFENCSIEDLAEHIVRLEGEIDRVKLALEKKKQQAHLASGLFSSETKS